MVRSIIFMVGLVIVSVCVGNAIGLIEGFAVLGVGIMVLAIS